MIGDSGVRDTIILGVPFSTRTNEETLDCMEQMVNDRSRNMVVTANLDFLVRAMKDPVCKRLMYGASMVTPDGMPMVWAGRTMKPALTERVAGSDFIPMLLARAAKKKYSVFFLGGREDIAARAAEKCQKEFPELNIVGVYSPPFGTVWEMDNNDIVDRINSAAPDILLVAFGNPKQEYWIGMNFHKLNVPVSIGVGGTIDFLSGAIPRAPGWMKMLSAEWLFRLSREPRRLAKRYALDLRDGVLPLFLQTFTSLCNRAINVLFDSKEYTPPETTEIDVDSGKTVVRTLIVERCNKQQVLFFASHLGNYISNNIDALVLDLRSCKGMDAETISSLASIDRQLRKHARHCIVVTRPLGALALRIARLHDIFPVVASKDNAVRKLKLMGKRTLAISQRESENGLHVIELHGELTGDSAFLLEEIDLVLERNTPILLDFSGLHILDTGGLQQLLDRWNARRGPQQAIHCIAGNSFYGKILSSAGLRQRFVLYSTIEGAMYQTNGTVSRQDPEYHSHAEPLTA